MRPVYVSYKCKPPQEVPLGDCYTQNAACGKEERPGEAIYYFPCGRLAVKRSVAIFSGPSECDPARYGLECVPYQMIFVARPLGQPKDDCIVGDDGRALQLRVECYGKKIIARYFPSRGTLVVFGPGEECLQKALTCF